MALKSFADSGDALFQDLYFCKESKGIREPFSTIENNLILSFVELAIALFPSKTG